MRANYTIGLDIGTNSVGWSVIKEDYQLVRRKMPIYGDTTVKAQKKNFWGVRLFDEGQTAESRRIKRTTRRRYLRRRNRLNYLQTIFKDDIHQLDAHFFHRLEDSFLVKDAKRHTKYPIFGTLDEEINYHNEYPTIYHLRKELADSTQKADIRLVYLAIAHIVKYRGHFLIEGQLNSANTSINNTFQQFLNNYNEKFITQVPGLALSPVDTTVLVESIVTAKTSRSRKSDAILALFPSEKSTGTFAQFIKLIVGNQGNFKKTFALEADAKLQFSKIEYEEELGELLAEVGDDFADVFVAAKNVYDAIELSGILSTKDTETNAKLSASMIERYTQHQNDLKLFKKYVREYLPKQYDTIFKDSSKKGYAGYIDGEATEEEFYKFVKKTLDNTPDAAYFIDKIDQENFLRKQRTYDNGVIPHQIHLDELNAILENQSKYYTSIEKNKDKIIDIMTFRIPYYVGPLSNHNSSFGWLTRKSPGEIRPWNFTERVDTYQSSVDFIERMTNNDSYLPTEKVLPKNSFLYQKYMIFNELTKLTYTNEKNERLNLSGNEKREIVNHLFKKHRKVTRKLLEDYFANYYQLDSTQIDGIETAFNAKYTVYHDFVKLGVPQEFLDDEANVDTLEDVVKLLTVFEDRKMIREQLKKYDTCFSQETLKKMERRHYTGWGRLSQKLLVGLKDKTTGKSIMDYLIEDDGMPKNINRNFMQLINDVSLSFKEDIAAAQPTVQEEDIRQVIHGLAGSPAIKKGILQSLTIVNEIVGIMGHPPQSIVIEMARSNEISKKTNSRLKALEKMLADFQSDLLKEYPTSNDKLKNDKLFLYYLQAGKDMYTGADLNIHALSNYDVDHIIPQSFIKDDSLDNCVLVSSKANRGKSDDVPSSEIVKKQKYFWKKLLDAKLISKRKYDNLTKSERGGLTPADKEGFIRRQLVETRQITKHVAQILDSQFNDGQEDNQAVQIVTLKSSLTNQFRKQFNLYKIRELNDYHHAHDAYLNAVVGSLLLRKYPQLKPEFVYGKFVKGRLINRFKATQKKDLYTNIMKFLKTDDRVADANGEIIWSPTTIKTIKRTLSSKQMSIVKKVEKQTDKLTNETIYPKAAQGTLIPRKNGLDSTVYGGFNSPTIVYSVLISHVKGKKKALTYDVIGISLLKQKTYEADKIAYLESLGFISPTLHFELPKFSLFLQEDGTKRFLASADELQKGNQLVLSDKMMALIAHSKKAIAGNLDSLDYVTTHREDYDRLLNDILVFARKYLAADNVLKKIEAAYEINRQNTIIETAEAFINLLKFTKIGAAMEFNFYDCKIARHRYRTKADFTAIFDGCVVNQSVTGLYESRWKIKR
ncbi:type II CRISPR RNA-guided endonuclease Cas9 [Vagococcus penaei]|uniref:CRISPR-associated endonuclease Cas9 n=1 Tax=Vagococcus penaei TaxID=633807 RepID=A0A1Q2D5C5_9ENTE|nr:type II CRISPR RNA-guided endonuclease Cas9 [Vagococcus penaei]AQP53606.1 type II CRISPR RNA-guided endonuclease Cas9 [Vagococcus penaei]RSU07550.1 type II CRISPR RNA-guided endonuclease Cas9 [Vagococcus penaei]